MAATRKIIGEWFDLGIEQKKEFMIIVCDTFSWEDYPVYTSRENFWEYYHKHDNLNMQKIMEVYDLNKDKNEQLEPEILCWNGPK